MKVDFHCHTKAIKDGEAEERNVDILTFKEKVELSEVKLLVITNHNHFDLLQYNNFSEVVQDFCMVWPGVELDVIGNSGKKGHLVLIANPNQKNEFNEKIKEIIGDSDVNDFNITTSQLISIFKDLDIIYSPHHLKSKQMTQQDILEMKNELENKNRLLLEPSSLNGVGILNINGYKGILGSDGHSWNNYEKAELGRLRFPVSNFENFCKVLDKDLQVMNGFINLSFNKEIKVFGEFDKKKYPFMIPIHNDVNIIYGDKGSGKSEILKSLNEYFLTNESIQPIYYSSSEKDNFFKKLLDVDWVEEINKYSTGNFTDQFKRINNFIDSTPQTLSSYHNYYKEITKNAKILKMSCLEIQKTHLYNESSLTKYKLELKGIVEFKNKLLNYSLFDEEKHCNLITELISLISDYSIAIRNEFVDQKSHFLYDNFVEQMHKLSSTNTGSPEMPTTTGFSEFAKNRLSLYSDVTKLKNELNREGVIENQEIGKVGSKGTGILETSTSYINIKNMSSIKAKNLNVLKTPLENFLNSLEKVTYSMSAEDLTQEISVLANLTKLHQINSVNPFITIKKTFKIKEFGTKYNPSSGEKAILNLQFNLLSKTDGEVFLIDEPELSLGGKYIEEIIVPLITQLGKMNKIVVIATHNANLAVRTRPINSIFKAVSNNIYTTYTGSMFTDQIINIDDKNDILSWIETSMDHLEGGEFAFEERMELYDRE